MLMLTRKVNEKIIISDSITLVVIAINGNRVKLGFDAPPTVSINREEVHKLKKEKE